MHSSCGRLREQHDQCSPWHGRLKRRKKMQTEKNEFEYELYQIMIGTNNTNRILNVTWKVQISIISCWSRGNYGMKTLEEVIFISCVCMFVTESVISVLPRDNPFSIRGEGTRQNWGRLAGESLKQLHGTGWGSTHTSKMRPKLNCVCIRSQQLTEVQKKK